MLWKYLHSYSYKKFNDIQIAFLTYMNRLAEQIVDWHLKEPKKQYKAPVNEEQLNLLKKINKKLLKSIKEGKGEFEFTDKDKFKLIFY